jgi:hypothetical protein
MKLIGKLVSVLTALVALNALAQVPDTPSAQTPAAAPAAADKPASSPAGPKFLGKDVPIFDPANEIVSWDGHIWNLNNNRVFEARFENNI